MIYRYDDTFSDVQGNMLNVWDEVILITGIVTEDSETLNRSVIVKTEITVVRLNTKGVVIGGDNKS